MTPATEALVERLEDRAQNGFEHPVVDMLLIEAAAALRTLSADHVSDPRQMAPTDFFAENAKNPPPAGDG